MEPGMNITFIWKKGLKVTVTAKFVWTLFLIYAMLP
jgi:hypothetical protein